MKYQLSIFFMIWNTFGYMKVYSDYNAKFKINADLSGYTFDDSVVRNESGILSLAECAMLCDKEICGSFSYSLERQQCQTFAVRFCSSENKTKTTSGAVYFILDSFIDGCNKPKDCHEVQTFCSYYSGVYTIHPELGPGTVEVYCDMETDSGGWTVFQRRMDGSEDFYRPWKDYKSGFGNLCGEYWLGNDIIHTLTFGRQYEMRVDLEDFENKTCFANYQVFSVADESFNYTLNISGYQGNCGDSLRLHNGQQFTTKDVDNDIQLTKNCANDYFGGWWYWKCHASNLNGLYLGGNTTTYANGIVWAAWRGAYYSVKSVTMKIRPT